MSELVSSWRCRVGYLAKKFRRNRAVKDEISIEQLNFLDRLPSPDCWCWAGCGPRETWIVMILWLYVRVRSVRVLWGQNGSGIMVLMVLVV
jgi:hypothetical protein